MPENPYKSPEAIDGYSTIQHGRVRLWLGRVMMLFGVPLVIVAIIIGLLTATGTIPAYPDVMLAGVTGAFVGLPATVYGYLLTAAPAPQQ